MCILFFIFRKIHLHATHKKSKKERKEEKIRFFFLIHVILHSNYYGVYVYMRVGLVNSFMCSLCRLSPGTCINNTSVMMFKKGSFEIGSTVYPVAIKVSNSIICNNTLANIFYYFHKNLVTSYLLSMQMPSETFPLTFFSHFTTWHWLDLYIYNYTNKKLTSWRVVWLGF